MDAPAFRQFDRLRVRYRPRPVYRGRPLNPLVAPFAGRELVVEVAWWMDDDDPYPGEAALGKPPEDRLSSCDVFGREAPAGDPLRTPGAWTLWIASGDVEVLEVMPWTPPKEPGQD